MNILIITGHPAQVHNFRNMKIELEKNGHTVYWLATDKDISKYLLNHYKIDYSPLARPKKNLLSKLSTIIHNTRKTYTFIRRNKIDIVFSRVSPYAAISCFILRKTHFALTDTETAARYDKFFGRLVSVLFTAKSYQRNLRFDQVRFDGNIELFYLHPKRFSHDENMTSLLGIMKDEPYIIMRFVSWDAYHDKGLTGFTDSNKVKAAHEFSKYAKVFITSEKELPESLEPYRIKIPPEKMHDVLANALLFFGESATMASESAVLGTPAIFLNENWFGSTDEECDFGLLFKYRENLHDQAKSIEKGIELLRTPDLKQKIKENKEKYLERKIDVTAFMVWFIENYPDSLKKIKENPDFQYSF